MEMPSGCQDLFSFENSVFEPSISSGSGRASLNMDAGPRQGDFPMSQAIPIRGRSTFVQMPPVNIPEGNRMVNLNLNGRRFSCPNLPRRNGLTNQPVLGTELTYDVIEALRLAHRRNISGPEEPTCMEKILIVAILLGIVAIYILIAILAERQI